MEGEGREENWRRTWRERIIKGRKNGSWRNWGKLKKNLKRKDNKGKKDWKVKEWRKIEGEQKEKG